MPDSLMSRGALPPNQAAACESSQGPEEKTLFLSLCLNLSKEASLSPFGKCGLHLCCPLNNWRFFVFLFF